MQVFRIRCCKQLHRVYFDGKRWAIPDCDTPEKKILLALNQQDSSCQEFMKAIRELVTYRRDISYVRPRLAQVGIGNQKLVRCCLLYTSDAADDLLCVDLGGRRIIKKKNKQYNIAYK